MKNKSITSIISLLLVLVACFGQAAQGAELAPEKMACKPVAYFSFMRNGHQFDFKDSSGTILKYEWTFGDGATSTLANPSHTYSISGKYLVCLVVTNDCGTDTYCDSVVACTLPVAKFDYTMIGNDVKFVNQSAGDEDRVWFFGDGGRAENDDPNYTYIVSGSYTVCLRVINSCGTDDTCQTIQAWKTGFETENLMNIALFPNPATQSTLLQIESVNIHSPISVQVYDMSGKLLRTYPSIAGNELSINQGNLAPGMYQLTVTSQEISSKPLRFVFR